MLRFPSIKVTTVTTPHPPASVGGSLAWLAALEAVLVSRFDRAHEWPVIAVAGVLGALAALMMERSQRRRIARGKYVAGVGPFYGWLYLQQLVAFSTLFGIAWLRTADPGVSDALSAPVFTSVGEALEALALLVFAPLLMVGLWLFAVAPVLGAAARAGGVSVDRPERPAVDRAPWRAAATVSAFVALAALPQSGSGIVSACLNPGTLITVAAGVVAMLVLLGDTTDLRDAKLRARALEATSLDALRSERRSAAIACGVSWVAAAIHVGVAVG